MNFRNFPELPKMTFYDLSDGCFSHQIRSCIGSKEFEFKVEKAVFQGGSRVIHTYQLHQVDVLRIEPF